MAGAKWTISAGTDVALSASTAKSVIGARAHANSSLYLSGYRLSFDGVTASAVPGLVEICYCTFGANGPGTNSTSVTPALKFGRSTTVGWTAARNWTAEPTTITVLEEIKLTPNGGTIVYDYPLQEEPDTALNEGFVIRVTTGSTPNVRATMILGRC